MSEKIKPCPFCGSENVQLEDLGYPHHVYCENCAARVTGKGYGEEGEADAIKAWNRRASGWISVDEPPADGFFGKLVINSENEIYKAQTVTTITTSDGKKRYINYTYKELLDCLEDVKVWDVSDITHITHWQPLPEPPEVEDDV